MRKTILLITLAGLFGMSASAQFRYTFKDTTTPYAPLTGATSINGSTIWDDDDFITNMPFTWKIDSSLTTNQFNLSLGLPAVLHNIGDTLNGFNLSFADLADRGSFDNLASLSPISYTVTGTSPNRIFKVEFSNAGFFDELANYSTMDDSVTFQVWVYETSNIFEYHFGPSKISYFSDYFGFTGGPAFGFGQNVDALSGGFGSFYLLKGNPNAPTIDTTKLPSFPSGLLNSWPASGKVYRFTPKWKNCTTPAVPTFTLGSISGRNVTATYTGSTTGIDSLVWNWGDGMPQKVTANYTTPVTHTYAAAGKYNIVVAAFNSCGPSYSTSMQAALAIGSVAAVGAVRMYPNPATDLINLEGLEAYSDYAVISGLGQTVLSGAFQGKSAAINITSLPAGMYSIVLKGRGGDNFSMHFIKR